MCEYSTSSSLMLVLQITGLGLGCCWSMSCWSMWTINCFAHPPHPTQKRTYSNALDRLTLCHVFTAILVKADAGPMLMSDDDFGLILDGKRAQPIANVRVPTTITLGSPEVFSLYATHHHHFNYMKHTPWTQYWQSQRREDFLQWEVSTSMVSDSTPARNNPNTPN